MAEQDESGARRARLLEAWERAGIPRDVVNALVEEGKVPLAFLDEPSLAGPATIDDTYEDLAARSGLPSSLVVRLHEALGFELPRVEDRAREDDADVVAAAQILRAAGASEDAILALVRSYADNLRRITRAEAELYETEIEQRLRTSGLSEAQLIAAGSAFGGRLLPALERMRHSVHRHHREHAWIEHALSHAEAALEQEGRRPSLPDPPAILVIDLTGYTRMTEEQGDLVAARASRELASIVSEVAQAWGGRPIKWLGDGGMLHFRHPGDAVRSALAMAETVPAAGLPPTHIGINSGPLIFQDGDVFGSTVNVAARIAAQAQAGEVLVSEVTLGRLEQEPDLRFEARPPVQLKGVAEPMRLHRVERADGRDLA